MSDLLDKLRAVAARTAVHAGAAARPFDTTIDDPTSPAEVVVGGRRTLMFGSNNYLGLSRHPEVIAAAREALERYGSGTTGSRAANGTLGLHRELERELAAYVGKRHGMIFTTGHQANLSLLCGLCGPDDVLCLDAESHASLFDGARLSGATVLAFRHNSPEDLAKRLARLPRGETNRLVAVEGVYSISGDVAPLAELAAACREGGAYLLVDEAHAFGVYGPGGRGAAEAQGVLGEVDFLVGTFSKSLAGVGGFCVSDHDELTQLHFTARSYVFTASGSPANLAGVRAALGLLAREPARRAALWRSVRRLREGLLRLGFRIGAAESPIVPIVVGDPELTIAFWQALLEAGLYVNLVLPPACPASACVVRTSTSAAHGDAAVDEALAIFAGVGRRLAVRA